MGDLIDKKREIMRGYERKRAKAQLEADERKKYVESQYPEIAKIEEEIRTIGMRILREVLGKGLSGEEGKRICEEMMVGLKDRKEQICKENGIPLNYASPIYQCIVCSDTGSMNDGKRCKCYDVQLIEEMSKVSNMKNLLEEQNFSSMDLSVFSDAKMDDGYSQLDVMMENIKVAETFINQFDEKRSPSLLFYGETGVGKTFLSSCIAKEIIDRGYTVMYKTSSQYIALAKEVAFGSDVPESIKEEYSYLERCDLLIIDDLGTEMANRFVVSEIYKLINARIVAGKKVIISTNLNIKEIHDIYTDRIFYRLIEGYKMLEFIGPNLRYTRVKKIFNNATKSGDS